MELMPPVALDPIEGEEARKRRAAMAMSSENSLPPAEGHVNPPGSLPYKLAVGATSQPNIPQKIPPVTIPAPELGTPAQPQMTPLGGQTMPAVRPAPMERSQPLQPNQGMQSEGGLVTNPITGVKSQSGPMDEIPKLGMPPVTPTAIPAPGKAPMAGPSPSQPAQTPLPPVTPHLNVQGYEEGGPRNPKGQGPELHGWKKALDAIGSMFPIGRGIEEAIPGTPQNFGEKFSQTAARAAKEQSLEKGKQETEGGAASAQFNTPEKRRAYLQAHPDEFQGATDFQKNDFVLAGKFPQKEPAEPKPEHADIVKEFSDALAKGDTERIDALTPRVKQYLDATQKPGAEKNTKEQLQAQIAAADAKGDQATVKTLQSRLKAIDPEGQQRIVINQGNANDKKQNAKDIAQAIIGGDQPPTLTGLRENTAQVRAELARSGFNLARAESDWHATQKHLATMNGAQQERLRQAVSFTKDSLSQVEDIYDQWQKVGKTSEWKAFNKGSMAAAKQLPGEPGNLAHRLEARVADLTSELGTVYKGGNSSTDESLKLAAKNLEGDWNEKTFKDAIGDIRKSIEIRENSIKHSQAAGVSANSPYTPKEETEGGGDMEWDAKGGKYVAKKKP